MPTSKVTESALEQATLDWLDELDYERLFGPDISPSDDRAGAERGSFEDVLPQLHTLAAIRDALLPKLLSGKFAIGAKNG